MDHPGRQLRRRGQRQDFAGQAAPTNVTAFVEMIPSPNGNSYRVRVGPELDRARAEATLKKMETEAGVKGMIVSYP
ncbi:SPOR domain-containing protein [Methylogaea oryzae]|uniref:SPOR domain-containing protein n=1 Tax=Methylogaea oryzae TaxID=1295382 RepID=UPI0020D03112|nr:SPOR domain-containing protein [Methylogaea oryzae]